MNRTIFFHVIRPLFGSLSAVQVRRIEAVLDGLEARSIPAPHAAYILGTAFHESDRFKTLEEYASGDAYEGRKDLGNTKKGDGRRFKGRGFVQITGRRNYADWSTRLGVDLTENPQWAERLDYATDILIDGMMLGTFTGKKLGDYMPSDYVGARRVVNGQDKADLIAGYSRSFREALAKAGCGEASAPQPKPQPIPKPVRDVIDDGDKGAESKTLWGMIASFLAAIAAGFGDLSETVQLALIGLIAAASLFVIYERLRKRSMAKEAKAAMPDGD